MSYCPNCGHDASTTATFCEQCGSKLDSPLSGSSGSTPMAARTQKSSQSTGRKLLIVALSSVVWVGIGAFFLFGPDGCSSTEGSLVSRGEATGDFTLTPTSCRSGQHEGFFGVYLVPDKDNLGGLKIIKDPVKDYVVQLELPGSCSGDECEVVTLKKKQCRVLKSKVVRTSTTVNDIVLLDGSIELDCEVKRKGEISEITANIKFESCD